MLFAGLLLFIFLIIVRPQDFVPGLRGAPLVFGVMGTMLAGWIFSPIPKKLFRTPQDKFVGLFFFAIISSALSTRWMSFILDNAVETTKIALIYYFVVTIADTKKKIRLAVWTVLFFMTLVACMGILQFHGIDVTGIGMAWASDKEVWQIRGIGNFDNPNDLAYSVVLIVPFAAGLLTQGGKFFRQIIGALLMIVALYCIYLTKSRGGMLSQAVCLAVWFYFRLNNKFVKRVGWMLAVFGIIAAFATQTGGYRDDKSAMGRINAWTAGMEMFRSHPLIGTGKNQFMEHHNRDSHNSFVRAGAELGLLGLYAYIGVLYSTTFFLLKSVSENSGINDEQRMYINGFLGYIASYCVASLFSTRTYDIVILLIIALISANSRLSMAKSPDGPLALAYELTLWNKKVALLTLSTLVIWKLFLVQVY